MTDVRIYVDRQELTGYTTMNLSRSKEELVGQASITVFMNWTPSNPVIPAAIKGSELLIYVAGQLAFNGLIDGRIDSSNRKPYQKDYSRAAAAHSMSQNSYTVTINARGKNKYLIDSSHQNPSGTIIKPSNRSAISQLVEPWATELDWLADNIDLERVRLRDGGRVVDEIYRIAEMCSLYIFETRGGVLRVTDPDTPGVSGEPLILGHNILGFSAEQAENPEKSKVTVKGQRVQNGVWGNDAVIPTLTNVADGGISSFIPEIVHLYGNATPELLNKRAAYEANKRSSQAKKVTIDTFHIQQSNGEPWELGTIHQVVVPPAEINGMLEVIGINFVVDAQGTLTTKLTLTPTNTSVAGDNGPAGGKWSSPSLEEVVEDPIEDFEIEFGEVGGPPPPVKIPNNK